MNPYSIEIKNLVEKTKDKIFKTLGFSDEDFFIVRSAYKFEKQVLKQYTKNYTLIFDFTVHASKNNWALVECDIYELRYVDGECGSVTTLFCFTKDGAKQIWL